MPTGFTAHIADGTETTLRQFALRCARGMGALVHMRDDPSDAPVPLSIPYTPGYHDAQLAAATEKLRVLNTANEEMIAIATATWNVGNEHQRAEAVRRNDEQRQRYQDMINQTMAWKGAPEGLKELMLNQLQQSMEFDCPADPLKYHATAKTTEQWFADEHRQATRDIEYAAKHIREDRDRRIGRNAWLAQLHGALPIE